MTALNSIKVKKMLWVEGLLGDICRYTENIFWNQIPEFLKLGTGTSMAYKQVPLKLTSYNKKQPIFIDLTENLVVVTVVVVSLSLN